MTRCSTIPFATSWCGTSKVRRTWRMAMRARAAAPAVAGWRSAADTPEAALAEAAAILNAAERPVILAGHGVLISGAMDELRALAERAQIPVAMTLLGIGGLPASHQLNIGMMG